MFRGPRQSRRLKIVKISGGRGGTGGRGGVYGGNGGAGEGPRVKMYVGEAVLSLSVHTLLKNDSLSARTVTNINSTTPAVLSGFRTIPLGDIDLQREIQLDMVSGVVNRRKLHSAKLLGDRERSDITVAMYQGAGAKQEWRRDIARYMAVRHPNIVQLYATAAYGDIHVAVFHDDLIPYREFLDL
ncbi:hypothetical protein C8R45DRAFT_960488 [Mycena sanguinolenta]|nr:hypothetical protein C8R45DRAFT_960488 [Mycena sanguinolenta]